MKRGRAVILDMRTSASDEDILKAVKYPAVGHPRRIKSPVTVSLYMPEMASNYLKTLDNWKKAVARRKHLFVIYISTGQIQIIKIPNST